MTIGELLEHCLKTRYYEPIYDGQGRKKGGVRSYKTVECHIKTIAAFLGSVNQGEGEDEKYVGGGRPPFSNQADNSVHAN